MLKSQLITLNQIKYLSPFSENITLGTNVKPLNLNWLRITRSVLYILFRINWIYLNFRSLHENSVILEQVQLRFSYIINK